MDMLVNALLKALGFTREQFDAQLEVLKKDLAIFTRRAENSEARISEILENQREILAWIREHSDKVPTKLLPQIEADKASDNT